MARYRGTLIFSSGSHGWTESYYLIGSDQTSAVADLVAISIARINILHTNCILTGGYVSDIAVRGDSITAVSVASVGTFVDTTGFLDVDLALLIKWFGGGFSRNKTFLRGVPNGQQTSGRFTPTGPYTTALTSYQTAVQAHAVVRQLRPGHAIPPIPSDYIFVTITSATLNVIIARRKSGRPLGLPRGRRLAG